ncbi:type II secretion system F family protein [Mycolicibacterium phlei]
MSAAAAALALALLVAPGPPRHRLAVRRVRPAIRIPAPACAAAAVLMLAVTAPVGVAAAAGIVASTVEVRRRRRTRKRVATAEAAALQGALEVLVGELRIGAHPVAAFDTAAAETAGTVAASLRTVAARARMGADVVAGLRDAARDSAQRGYWERLAVCWLLAETHGLAIATLMHTAYRDIVARERFSSQVAAGMAGARTTAVILTTLPLLGVALGELIGAAPLRFLLGSGQWLLVIGVTLACVGLLWSDRITEGVVT